MWRLLAIVCLVSPSYAAPDLGTPACVPIEGEGSATSPAVHDQMSLAKAKYKDLPEWATDKLAEAVPSFLKSCEKLLAMKPDDPAGVDGHGGRAKQWKKACAAAAKVPAGDDAAARAMFEAEFTPFVASGKTGAMGKLTGYYVQEIHASRKKTGAFQTAVLARPKDLLMIDLGQFTSDAHGKRLWGRMVKGELVPYYTREEIRKGKLDDQHLELMYVDDPVDLLFAQIEGSAKARFDDGTMVWLEFDGKNGRAYKGVGGVLRGSGELKPGEGTMQGIRKWFHEHPARYHEIADQDASYVFFKESKDPGAVGSQKTVLTTQRSAAVDRAFYAMSTPIFVEGHVPVVGTPGTTTLWHHLLIAQDTGAGIIGAVRADIYWGDDRAAEEIGGRMGGPGRYWVLLPNGVEK